MAIIYDDNFQSYPVGSFGPWGNLFGFTVTPPQISTDVPGIYGDTKSLSMPPGRVAIWPTLNPDNSLPFYSTFSVFYGLRIEGSGTNQQGTLIDFLNNKTPSSGDQVALLLINSDGTLSFQVNGGNMVTSDFSLLNEKWYWLQTNVTFSTNAGFVQVTYEVVVNGVSILSGTLVSALSISSLTNLYVNAIEFGGCGHFSYYGRLTIYDTIQAVGANPHPGSPIALVSQGVIELIKAVTVNLPTIPTCVIGTATLGTFYSQTFSVVGGVAPYTWAISAGALPTGLTIDPSTGTVSGVPITHGTFAYTVKVTDFLGHFSTHDCSIVVPAPADCAERFGPKLYFWEPSFLDRPEDTEMRATDWENAGLVGAKFVQGFLLHADTQGVDKQVTLQGDGASIQTYTVNHNGEEIKPYIFKPAAIASLLRVISPDTVDWRFFGIKYIWEPLPESVTYYKTQGTTHDIPGYQFLKDGYIALISTADVTLTIDVDGTDFVYTIPSTGGAYKKVYLIFGINGTTGQTLKGKLFTYELRSTDSTKGFRLFQKDSEVFVHAWGGGPYISKQPFGAISRLYGARI